MRAVLIANPVAHKVTDASRRVAVRALEATFDLELVATEERGHAASLAREAVDSGAKTVIAYGGDGTVNEVVNGMLAAGQAATLAVLPGGGTNVLARTLGLPNDLVGATAQVIEAVEQGRVTDVRIGRLEAHGPGLDVDRYFTFAAGLVLDAETVRGVDASGLRPRLGDLAFVYAGLRAFARIRKPDEPGLSIDAPDGPQPAWWMVACLSDPFTYFGKRGLRVAPRAADASGLHVVAGRSVRYGRTLKWLFQTLTTGRHVRHKDVLYLEDVPFVQVAAVRPVALQADGEFLGEVTELRGERVANTLTAWA